MAAGPIHEALVLGTAMRNIVSGEIGFAFVGGRRNQFLWKLCCAWWCLQGFMDWLGGQSRHTPSSKCEPTTQFIWQVCFGRRCRTRAKGSLIGSGATPALPARPNPSLETSLSSTYVMHGCAKPAEGSWIGWQGESRPGRSSKSKPRDTCVWQICSRWRYPKQSVHGCVRRATRRNRSSKSKPRGHFICCVAVPQWSQGFMDWLGGRSHSSTDRHHAIAW